MNITLYKKNKTSLIISSLILILLAFSLKNVLAGNSPDAIAIRIIPNIKHYSAISWYQEQNFSGSPQALLIDGYEAVRDGRTVYINVANVEDNNNNNILDKNDKLYTNIFVISYNQDAENATLDIFGQILANWKFNTNLNTAGRCKIATTAQCVYSSECNNTDFCNSSKAVTTRDVKRLSDIADVNTALDVYKNVHNGLCPKLTSGSYLPNKTISTWSSWQSELGKELNFSLPVDPINKLGKCKVDNNENKKYDPITCWNEQDKKFAAATEPDFTLPTDSLAYAYISSSDGRSCGIFATMESGLICDSNGGCIINNNLNDPYSTLIGMNNVNDVTNLAPTVTCGKLSGLPNTSFKGYVNATDQEGGTLTWEILTSAGNGVSTDWSTWSAPPALKSTAIPNQKEISASKAGVKGNYLFKMRVTDNKGSSTIKDCTAFIGNPCGNGIVENGVNNPPVYSASNFGEVCDGTKGVAANSADSSPAKQYACDGSCKFTGGWCGDGKTQDGTNGTKNFGEECDDGNTNNNDACDRSCKWTIKTTEASPINLSASYADALIFDNNDLTNTASDTPGGIYLKINGTQKTPYLWASLPSEGKVVKIRTYTGPKRDCVRNGTSIDCFWNFSESEPIGKVLGKYPSTNLRNPSRTAVNVETGDVWVHDRYNQKVYKMDINGQLIKSCSTDPAFTTSEDPAMCNGSCAASGLGTPGYLGNGGGLAIAKNGDIWAGNYFTGKVVRINGDDNGCVIKNVVNVGGNPYGLAIDSEENLWVKGGSLGLVRINANTSPITFDNFPALFYGLTVDADDNVWLSTWGGSTGGVQKINKNSAAGTLSAVYGPATAQTTGMTIDSSGNIWGSGYTTNTVSKFFKDGSYVFSRASGGSYPHGVCGDSESHVWVANINGGLVRGYNLNGSVAADVCVSGESSPGVCNDATMYTYSDMTGLNRAMVIRTGILKMDPPIDSGFENQHWGDISYDENIQPGSNTSAELYIRSSNDPTFLADSFTSIADWNAKDSKNDLHEGRYLQLKIILRSGDRGVTPVISNIRITN